MMSKEDKEWKEYLLSPSGVSNDAIGVTDLDNQEEISEKLDRVERENSEYEANIIEALNEFNLFESTPISDVRVWLESLGD